MKKYLGTAMSLALVYAALPAHAEILKNLKTNGSIDFQGRAINNVTDFNSAANDFSGQTNVRLQAGAGFDLSDDVSANVSIFKNNRVQGSAGETLNAAGTAGVINNINIGEANVSIKGLFNTDSMKLGRQYYGNGGDLVIRFGPSGSHVYGLPVTAVDGVRADKGWDGDKYHATAFIAKTATAHTVPTGIGTDGDTDLAGVEAMCTHNPMANMGLRVYQQKFNNSFVGAAAPTGNAKLYVADLMAKGDVGHGVSYTAEFAKNFGVDNGAFYAVGPAEGFPTAQGWAFLANAKWNGNAGSAGKAAASAEFGYGSGNDVTSPANKDKAFRSIASDYRPGMIYGGFVGVAGTQFAGFAPGLTNLTTGNIGAGFSPAQWEKLWLNAQGYFFAYAQPVVAGGNKSIGKELDLSATWKQSENVSVKFGYAWFYPGSAIQALTPGHNVTMGSADFNLKF